MPSTHFKGNGDITSVGQDYIEILKEKYQEARIAERQASAALEMARRRRHLYAQVLDEEGIDVRSLDGPTVVDTLAASKIQGLYLFDANQNEANGNGHKEDVAVNNIKPISDTHALYLLIRKHGNKGFTFEELKAFSDEAGYDLTEDAIRNTFWKQTRSKRMEKKRGRVVLTPAGELFNSFRAPVPLKEEVKNSG